MTKYWKLGIPRDMIALENRIDTLDMIYHFICDINDDDSIKAAIIGLHSYYQKKYQTMKEEHDRAMAKMIEDYENTRPIIMPEGEQ